MNSFQVYLTVTLSCNLKCPHCIRAFSRNNPTISIKYDELEDFFKDIKKNIQNPQIIITGGEPTLHKDFLKIVNLVIRTFGKAYICSNGIINNSILTKLCNMQNLEIQISLDGSESIHDSIRGDGSFKLSLNTINKLLKCKIPVKVSSTVNKKNKDSLLELAAILRNLDIDLWQIEMEQTFSDEEFKNRISIEDWNTFVNEILHVAGNKVSIKKLFDFNLYEKMELKYGKSFLSKSLKNCGFCSSKFYVYPDFSIRGCTCMEDFILGNWKTDGIYQILKKMACNKKMIDVQEDSICFNCRWKYFCNGGCPGYSYHFQKKLGFGDIRCPKIRYGIKNE